MKYKYYVDKDGKLQPRDVFVYLGNEPMDIDGNPGVYCPLGQHGTASSEYIKKCKEITREQYIEASGSLYTPEEYIA